MVKKKKTKQIYLNEMNERKQINVEKEVIGSSSFCWEWSCCAFYVFWGDDYQ